MARPFYKELTAEELRNEYHATRQAMALANGMFDASNRHNTKSRQAGNIIELSDNLNLIVNVARKKGITL